MEDLESQYGPKKGRKSLSLTNLKRHEIVDALGFSVDIDYAPRKVPLDQIFVDLKHFQNRKKPYSEHSVQSIINAVLGGNFDLRIFNPVILWKSNTLWKGDKYQTILFENSDDQKLYILAGHSRHEAFKRLSSEYKDHPMVQEFFVRYGYDFSHLPSLIMDDIKFEDAKFTALVSNALATIETDTERAEIYRTFRCIGKDAKFIEAFGRMCEKSNRSRVKAYSFLNPNGHVTQLLERFESGQDDNIIIKRIALWIGHLRQKYPQLSDLHEDELTDRLFTHGGYGNQRGQINNQNKFLEVVTKHIENLENAGKFNPDCILNVRKIQNLSFAMQKFYELLNDIRLEKRKFYTEFHTLRRRLNKRIVAKMGMTGEDHDSYIASLKESLLATVQKPIDAISQLEQTEQVLFDLEDYVNEENIHKIEQLVLDYIIKIDQDYYILKGKKDQFIAAGNQEIPLSFK